MTEKQTESQMKCPKCGFSQGGGSECRQCGLVFAKYRRPSGPGLSFVAQEVAAPRSADGFRVSRVWKWLFLVCLLLLIVSFFKRNRLPGTEEVVAALHQAPVQTSLEMAPFQVSTGDNTYTITPKFQYELNGLVVSAHDTGAWWDIYHSAWEDTLNVKDLCVVWGPNIATEVYRRMDFKSGSWTCWYRWKDRETGALFDPTSLSNNHLLADDPQINRLIMRASIGDQVRFRGYLAEYANPANGFRRGTSTTRTDTGNGACETVYIEEFQTIKRANPFWKLIFQYGWWAAGICLLLWLVFAVKEPYMGK